MKYCLYGTVYNNVNTVEKAIESVYDAIFDQIVITDNFSNDGTYEKLIKMKKDYNLKIYRLKSSRGLGMAYSLKKCPNNSLTAYIHLDVIYNNMLIKIMETELSKVIISNIFQWSYVAKKEEIINKGNWRDLQAAEEMDLISRVGIDYSIPIVIGYNASWKMKDSERRYSNGFFNYVKRKYRIYLDHIRGNGISKNYLKLKIKNDNENKEMLYKLISPVFWNILFKISDLYGKYHNHVIPNDLYVYLNIYKKIIDPKDVGLNNEKFMAYSPKKIYGIDFITYADNEIKKKISNIKCDYINNNVKIYYNLST